MIRGRQREIGRSLARCCHPPILAAFPGKKSLVILLLYKNLDTKRDRLRHKYAKGGSETDEGEGERRQARGLSQRSSVCFAFDGVNVNQQC